MHWDLKSDKEFRKQKLTEGALGQPPCGSISKESTLTTFFCMLSKVVFPHCLLKHLLIASLPLCKTGRNSEQFRVFFFFFFFQVVFLFSPS